MPQYRKKPGSSWSWNLVNVISPTTTNEFIFAYNHLTQIVDVVATTPSRACTTAHRSASRFKDLYPDQNMRNRFPQFSCGIGLQLQYLPEHGWQSEGKTYRLTDNLTQIFGSHTFKTGIFVNLNNNGQQPGWGEPLTSTSDPTPAIQTTPTISSPTCCLGNYTSVSPDQRHLLRIVPLVHHRRLTARIAGKSTGG